jgi:hypothetical protein
MKRSVILLCLLATLSVQAQTLKASLSKLSAADQLEFWDKAVISNGGVASFYVGTAKTKLSGAQYAAMLKAVGVADDHDGYACTGPGECQKAVSYLCNPQYCGSGFTTATFSKSLSKLNTVERTKLYNSIVLDSKGKITQFYAKDVVDKMSAKELDGLSPFLGHKTGTDLKKKVSATGTFKP